MPVFVSLECSFSLNYVIGVSSNTSYFCVYSVEILSDLGTMEHNEHVFFCGMDVAREQYNMKNHGKHEILFLDTCLLYLYLPPDWVGQ